MAALDVPHSGVRRKGCDPLTPALNLIRGQPQRGVKVVRSKKRSFHMERSKDDSCVYAFITNRASLNVALDTSGWPQIDNKYALLTYCLG